MDKSFIQCLALNHHTLSFKFVETDYVINILNSHTEDGRIVREIVASNDTGFYHVYIRGKFHRGNCVKSHVEFTSLGISVSKQINQYNWYNYECYELVIIKYADASAKYPINIRITDSIIDKLYNILSQDTQRRASTVDKFSLA